MNHLQIAIYWT